MALEARSLCFSLCHTNTMVLFQHHLLRIYKSCTMPNHHQQVALCFSSALILRLQHLKIQQPVVCKNPLLLLMSCYFFLQSDLSLVQRLVKEGKIAESLGCVCKETVLWTMVETQEGHQVSCGINSELINAISVCC